LAKLCCQNTIGAPLLLNLSAVGGDGVVDAFGDVGIETAQHARALGPARANRGDRARLQQFHEIKPGGGAGIGTLKGGKVPHARWHGGQAGVGVCQVTLAACLWQRGAARLQGSPISRAGRKVQNPGRGFAAGSAMQPELCSRVVLLTAVHLALPAGDVPNLNIMPGCQAAANGSVGQNRDLNVCLRNEH
jgi:hypothetical protein